MKIVALTSAILLFPAYASTEISVNFIEGAPKDRFVLTNSGACSLDTAKITLDLSTSASGVIFDVTESGAGVEVFQPFEVVSGGAFIRSDPSVADGDRAVTIELENLPAGESFSFSVDVDDTSGGREITVTDSELAGSSVSVQTAMWTASATFKDNANASVRMPSCS